MKRPSASALAVALLAASASANPQLSNQNSSGGSVSRTCQRILRQPVSGCTEAEFATGRCSRACADGLESTQSSIQEACDGVSGGPPFLQAALEDRLVEVACRRGVEEEEGDEDEDEDEDSEDGEQTPTTTGERERDVPETPAPAPEGEGGGGDEPSDAQPTGRTEERSGGDEGRPNGVGGSPFDIVAGGSAGLRVDTGWMALGLGVLLFAR